MSCRSTTNAVESGLGRLSTAQPAIVRSIALLSWVVVTIGCSNRPVAELEREELFNLSIGPMEDQLSLFQFRNLPASDSASLYMRDGLIYVANSGAQKVMKFSSYGDLLLLLYNPDSNPAPVSVPLRDTGDTISTRRSVPYPFIAVQDVLVDSRKIIFVQDVAPRGRAIQQENGIQLRQIVLRFSRQGIPLPAIGQEGLEGSPFPYIQHMYLTDSDELVVVARERTLWIVYWYSPAGLLRYRLELTPDILPTPAATEERMSLEQVFPDVTRPVLFLYFRPIISVDAADGRAAQESAAEIHILDVATARYLDSFALPDSGTRQYAIGASVVEVAAPFYYPLGFSSGGTVFLLRRESDSLISLLLVDSRGRALSQRYLTLDDNELYFSVFRLANTGVIYGLLGEIDRARIVWWRSDRLTEGGERFTL